ncbi:hypothetical protein GTV32_22780 [Gordonia sp. SID5947]|uniref:hypothetical protein n=1 Tax=Gordonia sp. SID5947 TaxID=2690315 RepID=UPI00136BBFDB|nr:hypothetical protein [Gordonia sp. SID5947]MYR08962.1 hypothetical protein [Gordonia sp. SID5947]
MFEWDLWPDRRTLRLCEPPRAVVVDMSVLDPTAGRPVGFAPSQVSLRVRAFGVRVEREMPARLVAWLQLCDGQWRALCELPIQSVNGVSRATVTLWVPPEAMRLPADSRTMP